MLDLLAPPRRAEFVDPHDLEAQIAAHHAVGIQAWPGVAVSLDAYQRAVADRVNRRATEPAPQVVATLPAADLYLAIACAAADPAAIAAFHAEVMPAVRPALTGLGLSGDAVDEIEQAVLVTVLVGERAPPAILGYGGRGRLRSWVRSIAIRTARRQAATVGSRPDDELDQIAAAVADPELELLRTRYRAEVTTALAAALAELPERARTVLRQYHLDGLTIDKLAALYRVDRATTARWVIAARGAILDGVRARLRTALGASPAEIESILRLVQSQLDLSLRLL